MNTVEAQNLTVGQTVLVERDETATVSEVIESVTRGLLRVTFDDGIHGYYYNNERLVLA